MKAICLTLVFFPMLIETKPPTCTYTYSPFLKSVTYDRATNTFEIKHECPSNTTLLADNKLIVSLNAKYLCDERSGKYYLEHYKQYTLDLITCVIDEDNTDDDSKSTFFSENTKIVTFSLLGGFALLMITMSGVQFFDI